MVAHSNARAPQRVVIAGGSGFVGSALTDALKARGDSVVQLTRSEADGSNKVHWDPSKRELDPAVIDEADVVINVAGASIAGGWWTESRKKQILDSRVDATATLTEAIGRAASKPRVFVSTSAVGFYGDRPGEILTELADPGNDFLADVCVEWEATAEPVRDDGVRVVHPRFGLVLDGSGGMLPVIRKPFQFGIGGRIGGDQYMSWIDLKDLVDAMLFVIDHEELAGPVNFVAPNPVTNATFTKAMGDALHRPAVIPIPARIAGLAGGELVQQLLLADQRAVPKVLEEHGFSFTRPTIDQTLDAAFRNKRQPDHW